METELWQAIRSVAREGQEARRELLRRVLDLGERLDLAEGRIKALEAELALWERIGEPEVAP